jgi:hypothetical protein
MFSFLMFLLWIASIIMMIVEFHWGWLVAFIVTCIYFLIRFGSGGGGGNFTFIDLDFGD